MTLAPRRRSPPVEKSGTAAEDSAERRLRIGGRAAQQVEQTGFLFSRINRSGSAVDAGQLRRGADGVVEIADLVDQLELQRLLAGENAAVGDLRHVRLRHLPFAPGGDGAHELRVQLRDDALEVRALGVGQDRKSTRLNSSHANIS